MILPCSRQFVNRQQQGKCIPALHFLLPSGIMSTVLTWLPTIFSRTWQCPLTSLPPQVEIMRTLILNSLEIHHFRGFRPRERTRLRRFKLIRTPKNTRQNATDLPCFFSWTRCQSDLSQGGHQDLAAGS